MRRHQIQRLLALGCRFWGCAHPRERTCEKWGLGCIFGVKVPLCGLQNRGLDHIWGQNIKSGEALGVATIFANTPNPKAFSAGVSFLGVRPSSRTGDCKIGSGSGVLHIGALHHSDRCGFRGVLGGRGRKSLRGVGVAPWAQNGK